MSSEDVDGGRVTSGASTGMTRRRVLVAGMGAAVGGAAVLAAGPAGLAGPAGASVPGGSGPAVAASRGGRSARTDVVGGWFEQVTAASMRFLPPMHTTGVAERIPAICWMAALGASDAAARYRASAGRRARFEGAAVATAVHDALVVQVPDQAGVLDEVLRQQLEAIPAGDAKEAGVAAGRAAAADVLADREGDGLDAASIDRPYTAPPEAPGVYRLLPGASGTSGAGLGDARPFVLGRADRFDPGPPPAVGTDEYRRGLWEVQHLGARGDDNRDETQSDTAWLAPGMQFTPALREVLAASGRSVAWKVRLLASYAVATTDSNIAVAKAKFRYVHWRPITAIRTAGSDGDPRTHPDEGWWSYLETPPNPDWPSGHATGAGAGEKVLESFVGPRSPVAFTATWRRGDGKVVNRTYGRGTRWSTLTRENVDARVWAGVHFRFSDDAGAVMGRRIGGYDVRRLQEAR